MNRKSSIRNFAKVFGLNMFMMTVLVVTALSQEAVDSRQARLVALLSSGNEEQKLEAAIELGALLSTNVVPTSQTISALGNVLQAHSSSVLRALAARAMELSRDERFVSNLLASLKIEREPEVSKAIIHALAVHRSPEVVTALLPLIDHKKQDIRAATAYALAEIGDPATTATLIDVLRKRSKGEDAFARAQAARGLGKIGNREAIDILLTALTRDDSSEVRREAALSLGQIANSQDAKVIEALKTARHQPDPYLQSLAASALEKLKP